MGLPLFITPAQPEVASKAGDKIASGPRSSIRRQRTIRGPLAPVMEARRRRLLAQMPEAESEELEVVEGQQGNAPTDTEVPLPVQTRAMRLVELQRMRARDALSFERQQPSNPDVDGPLMPPVPESRDYSVTEEREREIYRLRQVRQDLPRITQRHPAPTPPYAEGNFVFLSVLDRPRISPSLSPIPSPTHQASTREGDMDSPPRRSFEEAEFTSTVGGPPYTASLGRFTPSERVEALHRMASNIERSRRLNRQSLLDGLGDRDRSISPEGGTAWETLPASITPDPQPPSAGASFASTSAAASASVTSLDQTGDHGCDASDSGSNTEHEDEDIYGIRDLNGAGGRGDRPGSTSADAGGAAARQDSDFGGLHRIISRMVRRDEIPDNYWASAGLSRNLRREPTI